MLWAILQGHSTDSGFAGPVDMIDSNEVHLRRLTDIRCSCVAQGQETTLTNAICSGPVIRCEQASRMSTRTVPDALA